ncbi:MAG: hypothetical protein LUI39_02570 [Lachnospiraceae bacterium]|nr:hypothetical protein [Lachnospiraceae bacterium]
MAGKRNRVVVAVISGMTDTQAADVTKEIMKAKQKKAPNARGTIASGNENEVGGLLQQGYRKQIK